MKRLLSCFLTCLILLSVLSLGLTGLAVGSKYIVDKNEGARLYIEKSSSSQWLSQLRQGTIVTALEDSEGFVRVSYEGYSGWLKKTDLKEYVAADPLISHIQVTKKPDKTEYYENDRYWKELFDPTGLEVTAFFTNGTTQIVTPEIYTPIMTEHGENTAITLSYRGHYTETHINIHRQPLKKIELTSLPQKLEYKEGSELDITGLSVTAFYIDPSWEPRVLEPSDFQLKGYDKDSPGIQTIEVKYKYDDIRAEFQVEVIPKYLESITIIKLPNKLDYYGTDRDINLTGLEVTALYDNGFTKTLTGVNCEAGWLEDNPSYDKKTKIWLSFTDGGITKTVNFDVFLHTLKAISLNVEGPAKKDYLRGDKLDTAELLIYLEYNSGKKEYITKDFELTEPNTNIAGTHIVSVKYGDFSTSFQIQVWSTNLYGDVNFDLKVTAVDARRILRASAKLENFNAEQIIVASMGREGNPRAVEARTALRISARLEDVKYIF